jgi:hypothetical protein
VAPAPGRQWLRYLHDTFHPVGIHQALLATSFAVEIHPKGGPRLLVELGVAEQRFAAVREVLDGASVTDVARRNGVARQTVHTWLR